MNTRSLNDDVFKAAKNTSGLKKIHKYTTISLLKTVFLNVLLFWLVISLGFDKKTDIQRLSERYVVEGAKKIISGGTVDRNVENSLLDRQFNCKIHDKGKEGPEDCKRDTGYHEVPECIGWRSIGHTMHLGTGILKGWELPGIALLYQKKGLPVTGSLRREPAGRGFPRTIRGLPNICGPEWFSPARYTRLLTSGIQTGHFFTRGERPCRRCSR
jgi:hypothetical protein